VISLSDAEPDVVCRMARDLPLEKRGVYLERTAAILQRRAGRHDICDVITAAEASLRSPQVRRTAAGI
jgi:hypothetical protein